MRPGFGISTNRRGHYEFFNLPPGRYLVGVSDLGPTPGEPYVEADATTDGGEMIIVLGPGGQVILQPLRLTRMFPLTVAGSVLNEDGTPGSELEVSLWWATAQGSAFRTGLIKTDSNGRFQVPAWQGVPYRLEVGPRERPVVQVLITAGNEPLAITIER